MGIYFFTVRYGDTGALLTAMLKRVESEEGETRNIFARSIDSEDAALLMWMITKHYFPR